MSTGDSLALRASTIHAEASVLNLAPGCLGVVKAIADSSVESTSLAEAARVFFQWLSRERIDEAQFETWTKPTSGLATVNDSGADMLASIRKRSTRYTAAGIPIVFPFSVGRALASKATHQYLVTTVAIAMSFHNLEFAATLISNMIFDEGGHEKGVDYDYQHINRALLKSVTRKVVESIALNVVNAGMLPPELPSELQPFYCGKVLDAETLAAVTMAIQSNRVSPGEENSDFLLECDELYGDLTCWILNHFHGRFGVSVNMKNVFDCNLGRENRKVTMLVTTDPIGTYVTGRPDSPYVRLSTGINSAAAGYFIVDANPSSVHRSTPSTRLPLYFFEPWAPRMTVSGMRTPISNHRLNQLECYQIQLTAQQIANWLLDVPIMPSEYPSTLAFTPILGPSSSHELTIGNLVSHWPGLVRIGEGQSLNTPIVFRPTSRIKPNNLQCVHRRDGSRIEFPGKVYEPAVDEVDFGSEDIAQCFPSLVDLLQLVKPRCGCHACLKHFPLGQGKPGCLRETAYTKLLELMGHAIAECFGSKDVSGLQKDTHTRMYVETMLKELLYDKMIRWDTWFSVAVSVHLGCSWPLHHHDTEIGAGEVVAVQYGSSVVAATWSDLLARSGLEGVFGFDVVDGRIKGLSEDFAVVQAEETARQSAHGRRAIEEFVLADDDAIYKPELDRIKENHTVDSTTVDIEHYVFNAAGQTSYRLITIVKTSRHRRIINPADAIKCLSCSKTFNCNHRQRRPLDEGRQHTKLDEVQVESGTFLEWAFDDLLSEWRTHNKVKDRERRPDDTVSTTYATLWLDTPLKQNIAMCLSPLGAVIRYPDLSCFACAAEKAGGTSIDRRTTHGRILNMLRTHGRVRLLGMEKNIEPGNHDGQ